MSILKVSRLGHPVLRMQSQGVTKEALSSPAIQTLIDNMIETMIEYSGVGLAAPQVHYSLTIAVIESHGPRGDIPLTALVNPDVSEFQRYWNPQDTLSPSASSQQADGQEGGFQAGDGQDLHQNRRSRGHAPVRRHESSKTSRARRSLWRYRRIEFVHRRRRIFLERHGASVYARRDSKGSVFGRRAACGSGF